MKKLLASSLLLSVCSLFAACGGSSSHAVGTYQLEVDSMLDIMKQAMPAEMVNNPETEKTLETMRTQIKGSIELLSGGQANIHFEMPMAKPVDETGTWTLAGEKITFVNEKDGKKDTKEGTLKGGILTITDEQGGQKMVMTFKKQ